MKNNILLTSLYVLSMSLTQAAYKTESSLGSYLSNVTYDEPDVMNETSVMSGLTGFYEIYDTYGFRLESNIATGSTSYSSYTTGTMEDIPELHMELRGIVNRHFSDQTGFVYKPYFGVGYRYLDSNSDDMYSTTGHYGYDRQQIYLYEPIGIEVSTPEKSKYNFRSTIALEYDHFLVGNNQSNVATSCSDSLSFEQNDGYGYRLKARFERKTKNQHQHRISVEPFYKYWHVNPSSIASCINRYFIEPENSSSELGVSFAYLF